MARDPVFANTVHTAGLTFVNADGTTPKTLVTAGANGTKVSCIVMNYTAAVSLPVMNVLITNASVSYQIGCVTPAGGSFVSENLLTPDNMNGLPCDPDGNTYLFLANGDTLQFQAQSAVTSGQTCYLWAFGVDF